MASTYRYKGTTYVAGEGKTAKQVAADYNPELKSGSVSTSTKAPTTSTKTSSTPKPAYNAATGATIGQPSDEYISWLKSQDQGGITITPESLTPKSLLPFQQTDPAAVPDISELYKTPPMELTPTEKEAQTYSDTLRKLNSSLVGKSAYTQEQEKKFGIPDIAKTVTDLGTQLTTLKNEAASIPLQLQQGAAERGVTTSQLGRQENSRLRTNAIQALGVASLMAAAEGNLATALSLVDRAVAAKFDPIQEQINAVSANLQIIMDSPQFSLEQKNRAQKQLDIQAEKQAKLEEHKERTKQIQTIALEAAAAGADSVTLTKIQNAKDPVEAASVASIFQQTADNIQEAFEMGIQTPLVNKNGLWFSPTKKKTYTKPEELFADFPQLRGDFNNAYRLGLVTDLTADRSADREYAAEARAKYPDAGIDLNDTPEEVAQKIQGSALYGKDIYISPENQTDFSGSIGGDPNVDARVKAIIRSNPGEYGNAAKQIDDEFGEGSAALYDEWLRRVYNYGQNIDDVTSGKAPTEGQRVSAGYATRLESSDSDISKMQDKIKDMSLLTWEAQRRLPDSAKTNEFRQYEQAVKNFVTAKLRKESGAAISQSEFDDAYRVYIPIPGDNAQTLEQKAKTRRQAIGQETAQAGTAYNIPASSSGVSPGMVKMRGVDPTDGQTKEWEVPQDQVETYKQNGFQQLSFNKAGNAIASRGIITAVQRKYPQGSVGGQCTTFLHKLVDFPSIGDGKNAKFASVNRIGIPKARWSPRVGDVVVSSDNPTYGHTFLINQMLPGNKAMVTESNFRGNERVTHTRIVNLSDPKIYGAIRGKPKYKAQLA